MNAPASQYFMPPVDSNTQYTVQEKEQPVQTWLDYIRFGESYTSLILGIMVVIITTALLIFLVKDRNATRLQTTTGQVSSTSTKLSDEELRLAERDITPLVTQSAQNVAGVSAVPTLRPSATSIPTVTKTPTQFVVPTKIAQKPAQSNIIATGKQYVVAEGDSLWTIAEKQYKSGYNWIDIAKANNISDPNNIKTNTKIVLPNVQPKTATVTISHADMTEYGQKITSNTYDVQKGDSLWAIAVRAYGNGFKWTEIAKANNIATPNIIHVNTSLKIPRL